MLDATAIRLALQLLNMKPEDLLHIINSAQGSDGEHLARSTLTRWANGSTPLPAAVKALLRRKLLDLLNNRIIELPRRITVAFVGKGGTGRTTNSMFLTALARILGIPAVYLDPVNGEGLSNNHALSVAKTALPSEAVVVNSNGDLQATLNKRCPENGLVFIDCPARLFLGRTDSEILERTLLETVDHFVITSDTSILDLQVAQRIATSLKQHQASFRLLLNGSNLCLKQISDTYKILIGEETPHFRNYLFGNYNSFKDRMTRYEMMRRSKEFDSEDSPLLDTLGELLEEFNISLEEARLGVSESSSFLAVLTEAARAKGIRVDDPQ